MTAKSIWLSLLLTFALLAAHILPEAFSLVRQSTVAPAKLVEEFKSELAREKPVAMFTIWDPVAKGLDDTLFSAESFYPVNELSPVYRHLVLPDCKQMLPSQLTAAEKKAAQWIDYKCHRAALPQNFFATQPFNHPFGNSWVWYAYENAQEFSNEAWLNTQRNFLTVYELASVISESEARPLWKKIVLSLSPAELTPLQEDWHQLLLAKNWVFFKTSSENADFQVFAASTWNKMLSPSLLRLTDVADTACLIPEGDLFCWSVDEAKLSRARSQIYLFVLSLIVFLALVILQLWRSRAQLVARTSTDRLLMVEILTHELRHPVTGMRLSLEAFRDHYDSLKDDLREEFLRMTAQMQRLQRLIFASQQYLQMDKQDQLFSFKMIPVESFNDYMLDLLESYGEKIEVTLLSEDGCVSLDPYWFGMCVTNLVNNALMHGKKPIHVVAEKTETHLTVAVSDSGSGLPDGKWKASKKTAKGAHSDGMGVGLSLVVRIIQLMGGKISYRHSPAPTFILELKTSGVQQ